MIIGLLAKEPFLAFIALAISAIPATIAFLKEIRRPMNIDLLMLVASIGAAAIGAYEEGAAVLVVYNIAEFLEDLTVERVKGLTKSIAKLLPTKVLLKRNGRLIEVDVKELKPGDLIVVKPGQRVPVDGVIVSGETEVDRSAVTGESIPVVKREGDKILSGVLNIISPIEVMVEKKVEDSMVGRIVKLVTEAKERKARFERLVSRFARFYTPIVLLIAFLVALIPPLIFSEPVMQWIYRALVVLVIACPSAFIISTPVTVLIGMAKAMKTGALIKGGRYFEELARVVVAAFDKTGTITTGKMRVAEVRAFNGFEEDEVLRLAAMANSRISHPISDAIRVEAELRGLKIENYGKVNYVKGKGVIMVDGTRVIVGRPSFLEELGVNVPRTRYERTTVMVSVANKVVGLILLEDKSRVEAKKVVEQLKKMGKKVVLVSGDSKGAVERVAKELGFDEFYAELLPEEKVEVAKKLRERYGALSFVGDGVNDGPVLAVSNVGIAVATGGNDVAIEAADVALIGERIDLVPWLLGLGKKVVEKLKLNIFLALAFKAIMISLGIMGMIPLWIAVLGDDGITILLISNSLSLLRFNSKV